MRSPRSRSLRSRVLLPLTAVGVLAASLSTWAVGPAAAATPSTVVTTLFDAGNEIAGHTLHHVDLKPLTTAEARQEVCTDRNNLLAEGFPATSFAYPFGSFDSGTELVVHDCGYNSGRGVSGVTKNGPYAETIPPLDPYATRTPPNPKKATKLSTLELYVQNAEANGGGW